jgi:hypothetical protein
VEWAHSLRLDGEGPYCHALCFDGDSLKPLLNAPYFKMLTRDQQVKILDAFWRALRNLMLDEAFDEPEQFVLQKGVGVMAMHLVLVHVLEIVKAEGLSVLEPVSYKHILKEPLGRLQGETAMGEVVTGLDFWCGAPVGAAATFSSSAGRRVLVARIVQLLPKVSLV